MKDGEVEAWGTRDNVYIAQLIDTQLTIMDLNFTLQQVGGKVGIRGDPGSSI